MSEIRCTLDYETRSRADLTKKGAIEYAKDPSTSIFCLGYKINDGEVGLWIPELTPMPSKLWQAFTRGTLVAHNAGFERAITRYTLPRYDTLTYEQKEFFKGIKASQWRCTAAKAAACSLPRSLEMAAKVLGLPTQKDMAGSKLIKKYSKPRKPTKKNPSHWWNDPKDLRRIYDYCMIDVQVEYELDEELPDLSEYEQRVWELDQKINDRGILIDIPAVKIILKMIHEESKIIAKRVRELSKGTIEKPTQTAKVLSWVNARGAEMENLRAETIRDKLLESDVPPKVRLMLEYRQNGSKTSTGKYISMLHAVGSDHRARELLLYHGAIPTARWAGKRIQPQNFPRPTIKGFNSDEAIELIKRNGVWGVDPALKAVRKKYGETKVMEVLVNTIRGMLIASPENELYCADFSAVEARLAFWVAEHEEGLQAFRKKLKLYEMMAAETFDMLIEDIEKDSLERFVGKESVLGCFGADTPVLTDTGWKQIIDVNSKDKVWDGVEWVKHMGVHYQGHRKIINLARIKVTPDHLILTPKGWVTALQAQEEKPHFQSAIELAHFGLKVTDWDSVVALSPILYLVYATLRASIQSIPIISKREKPCDVANVEVNVVESTSKNIGPMRKSYLMTRIEQGCSTEYQQQFKDVITQRIPLSTITAEGGSKYIGSGGSIEKNFSDILLPSRVGIIRFLKWIGQMLTKATNPAISDLSHTKKTPQTEDPLSNSKKFYPVFDVINAGPRNRFTILTEAGPLIVHNCQYGMGWLKFKNQCHKKGMSKVTDQIAKKAVYTYRRVHYPIPVLWKNLENAAIAAILKPGSRHATNKVVFYVSGKFLNIKLPSGRRLRYYKPRIRQKQLRGGRMVPEIRYWGMEHHQWKLVPIWGGIFCNHIVQGIARDLMVSGIFNIDGAGYEFLLSVHDEGLSERKKGFGDLKEYIRLMTKLPDWAKGAPITAEGWVGPRYKKG